MPTLHNRVVIFSSSENCFFDWDQIFYWDQILILTETDGFIDRDREKNSNDTPKNEDEVEGAKPPDEVERSETSGERSEPVLCKS